MLLLLLALALLCVGSVAAPARAAADDAGITVEGMAEPGGARRQYSCPARFIRMGNSCYFMSTLMASWHDAHFKCRSMGAQLAAFEKRWENRNMRKYLMHEELTPLSRWIGGIYQWEKRFWMWGSTGLAVSYKAFPRRMVTQDWTWHCISMDPTSDYQWRPASCLDAKHYICETPLRRNRTRGGHGRGGGNKQHTGPRRNKSEQEPSGKKESSAQVQAPAGRHHQATQHRDRTRNGTLVAASASGRRVDAGSDRRPSTFSRNRTAYRRPYPGQHHGHRGYRPPPPPPGPRQQGRTAVRPAAAAGAVGAASHHQPHRLAYNAYDVLPAPAAAQDRARGPSQGVPRQRGGARDSARISFKTDHRSLQPQHRQDTGDARRHLEIPDMTVQSLYPPQHRARAENNDFSNDV